MNKIVRLLAAVVMVGSFSCKAPKQATKVADDGLIELALVQVNDVYEIAPVSGGKEGGMARVATLKNEIKKEIPNTFLVMAGDFLSPSVYNSLKYEGTRIRGKQMVDAMNAAGMDFVVFGNHEFDITENELQERINESKFQWISSNTFHNTNGKVQPFVKYTSSYSTPFPETYILNIKDADGTTAKIGFIGLTLSSNKASYVSYTDPNTTAINLYNRLKDSVDAVVALTHLSIADDKKLAEALPGLAAILGGHEHDMRFEQVGNVFITKAHANARSAYVIKLRINKNEKKVTATPELKMLDGNIAMEQNTQEVVEKWTKIASANYGSLGFDPTKVVIETGEALDGRESISRKQPTNLTRLLVKSMEFAAQKADFVVVNSGSIRLDDIIYPPITQYDIIRTMPFGGGIREVDMKGSLLLKILNVGLANRGTGGYLLYSDILNFNETEKAWKINKCPLDEEEIYRVAMSDFLLTGLETKLDFLTPKNPEIVKVYDAVTDVNNPLSDVRMAIIKYMESLKK